jgi:hypothetical protein
MNAHGDGFNAENAEKTERTRRLDLIFSATSRSFSATSALKGRSGLR